jgi:hypothetical protein
VIRGAIELRTYSYWTRFSDTDVKPNSSSRSPVVRLLDQISLPEGWKDVNLVWQGQIAIELTVQQPD